MYGWTYCFVAFERSPNFLSHMVHSYGLRSRCTELICYTHTHKTKTGEKSGIHKQAWVAKGGEEES